MVDAAYAANERLVDMNSGVSVLVDAIEEGRGLARADGTGELTRSEMPS